LQRAIAGGGRYDELVSQLGGPRLGGIGFATSDVVIQDVLTEFDLLPELESVLDFFVIDADATAFAGVLEVVGRLRAAGVSTGFSFARQSINKQFKQAAGATGPARGRRGRGFCRRAFRRDQGHDHWRATALGHRRVAE
jgi:histidyl-tRNA synthetase